MCDSLHWGITDPSQTPPLFGQDPPPRKPTNCSSPPLFVGNSPLYIAFLGSPSLKIEFLNEPPIILKSHLLKVTELLKFPSLNS